MLTSDNPSITLYQFAAEAMGSRDYAFSPKCLKQALPSELRSLADSGDFRGRYSLPFLVAKKLTIHRNFDTITFGI